MDFFRVIQHLLPTGQAWRTTIEKNLRRFLQGLAEWPVAVVEFSDAAFEDIFPDTTRELPKWQEQFALVASDDEATDRLALDAAWKATGGQSPGYLQSVLQAAGFDLYVHEWTADTAPPYTGTRNPLLYINQPLIGEYQCCDDDDSNQVACFDGPDQARCNAFVSNETHYLVNKDLTHRPPPRMPETNDDGLWEGVMYIGPEVFPADETPLDGWAEIPITRREELERLLLQLRPLNLWIVLLIDWTGITEIFDDSFDDSFN